MQQDVALTRPSRRGLLSGLALTGAVFEPRQRGQTLLIKVSATVSLQRHRRTLLFCPELASIFSLLTLLLTLCGLTSQETHRGGLELGGLVHEEAVSLILFKHPSRFCVAHFTEEFHVNF